MQNTLLSSVYIFSWAHERKRGAWNGHTCSDTNNNFGGGGGGWVANIELKQLKKELTRNVMCGFRGERDLCKNKNPWQSPLK